MKFGCRSGTLVFAPTEDAMRFATAWDEASRSAPWGSVDQDALGIAMGRAPGVCFQSLDVRYCARPVDNCPNPVIFHDSASENVKKVGRNHRLLRRLWDRLK
jgi:hypothetical protein